MRFSFMDVVSEGVGSPSKAPSEPAVKSCEVCGVPGALKVGDRWLCESCYVEAGSCCPEFGGNDLWEESSGKKQK